MLHLLSPFPIRPAVSRAPVSTPPATPPGPGACAHDSGLGVLPKFDWPFDDMVAQDDPPLWVWVLILGTLFAVVFFILGYCASTLVAHLRAV